MAPFVLVAMILPSASAACVYCWLPSSARLGALPGFQAQTWPSVPVMMAWSLSPAILPAFMLSGRLLVAELVVLSFRYWVCPSP